MFILPFVYHFLIDVAFFPKLVNAFFRLAGDILRQQLHYLVQGFFGLHLRHQIQYLQLGWGEDGSSQNLFPPIVFKLYATVDTLPQR